MTSPKAFLKLPTQRPVESAKEPDAADKYLPQLGIWGLCLPAEKGGDEGSRAASRSHTFLIAAGRMQAWEHLRLLEWFL